MAAPVTKESASGSGTSVDPVISSTTAEAQRPMSTVSSGMNGRAGTVFGLVKSGAGYTLTTLVSFNGTNGAFPDGSLIADALAVAPDYYFRKGVDLTRLAPLLGSIGENR